MYWVNPWLIPVLQLPTFVIHSPSELEITAFSPVRLATKLAGFLFFVSTQCFFSEEFGLKSRAAVTATC